MIDPFLPSPSGKGRRLITDRREGFNAIQFLWGTGCPWRCVPPLSTVQNDDYAWRKSGVFDRMRDALRDLAREPDGRPRKPTAAVIDRPSVAPTESGDPAGSDAGKKAGGAQASDHRGSAGISDSIRVPEASIPDREGDPEGIRKMPEKAPQGTKGWAAGGSQGPKRASAQANPGSDAIREIVRKLQKIRGSVFLYRRRLRTLASAPAWAQRAACRFLMRRVARVGP